MVNVRFVHGNRVGRRIGYDLDSTPRFGNFNDPTKNLVIHSTKPSLKHQASYPAHKSVGLHLWPAQPRLGTNVTPSVFRTAPEQGSDARGTRCWTSDVLPRWKEQP